MSRPAVLIVEPDAQRRHRLGQGLASEGYEVVPSSSVEEGLRFAEGLGPAVIIAPAGLSHFGDASVLTRFTRHVGGMARTLVLLGETAEEERHLELDEVVFLATVELSHDELMRRLRLVLVGREIGIATDAALESLVGDLALRPMPDLLRALERVRLDGRIELDRGAIELEGGRVVAARAGRIDGLKAFCRLARLSEAAFRVISGVRGAPERSLVDDRRIELDLESLLELAAQDMAKAELDPLARLRPGLAGDGGELSALEGRVVQAARQGVAVQEMLDALHATDGEIVQVIQGLAERGLVRLQAATTAVRLVTDSTADLSPEMAREHGVSVIPHTVRFGGVVYRDRVDLLPRDFYRILEQKIAQPETEPAEVEVIERIFTRLAESSDVLALHVSRRLSEGHDRAQEAAERTRSKVGEEHQLAVVDSGQISMGLGLQVLFAARMAHRGLALGEILRRLEAIRGRLLSYSIIASLDALVAGGRVGKLRAVLQGMFDIRPILTVEGGDIQMVDKARGQRAAQPRLLDLLGRKLAPDRQTVVAITHANTPEWADRMRRSVEERFEVRELILTEAGPVIGAHVGPGALGVTAYQPSEEEAPLLAPLGESSITSPY